jgi:hypothetical protein
MWAAEAIASATAHHSALCPSNVSIQKPHIHAIGSSRAVRLLLALELALEEKMRLMAARVSGPRRYFGRECVNM